MRRCPVVVGLPGVKDGFDDDEEGGWKLAPNANKEPNSDTGDKDSNGD